MEKIINVIIKEMDCNREEAIIILDNISNKKIIQNAIKIALKNKYDI